MATKPVFKGFGSAGEVKKGDAKGSGGVKRNFVLPTKRRGPVLISKNKETIQPLCESLTKQPKFGKMVLYSVGCVDKLAVDVPSAEEIINEGAVEAFMVVLKANPHDEQIAAAINNCLKNLAKNARLAAMIAARLNGNYKAFQDSLENHIEPQTLISTCGVIAALTKGTPKEITEMMARQGMHASLAQCITKHKGQSDLLAAATEALSRFGDDAKIAGQIIHSGAVEEILKEVALHPERIKMVQPAVHLIAALSKFPELRDKLKKMGAVDVLVTALEAHPYNDELLADAAEALKHLTGATDMGMALAQVTKGDTALDAKTAAALSKIASLMLVGENVDYLHKNHGVDWLMSILKSAVGKDDSIASKILANGCRVLMRAGSDEKKVYDILKKGGVQLLTSILSGHMGDDKVVESALTALAKLVTRKENAAYIAQLGGIKAAIQAVEAHPDNENIAKSALELFSAMAQYPETGEILVKQGALKSLMGILNHHSGNPEIARAAITALGRLATSPENVQEMIAGGLLPTLLGIMKKHPEERELVKDAMIALETACLLPETAGKIRSLGGVDTIKMVMGVHPEDEEIQEVASRLFDAINLDPLAKQKLAEAERLAEEEEEAAESARVGAERMKMEASAKAESEKLAEQEHAKEERARRLREADDARIRAEKLEQQRMEAEMSAALEAMQASADAARLRAAEEERRAKEKQKGKLAAEMEAAKLRALEEQRKLEDIERKRREIELMRKKAAEKSEEEAAARHLHKLAGQRPEKDPEEPKRVKLKKSARELFEADEEKDKKIAVLPIPIRNFLLAGQLLKKHSKKASPKMMHFYLSPDIEWMVWKEPNKSEITIKQRMRIYKLYGVNTGRCTPQLQRKTLGRYNAKEECSFSVYGANLYKEERTIDFEAPTPKDCQAWVHAMEVLIEYAKNRTLWGGETVAVRTDKDLTKMGFKEKPVDDEDEGVSWGSTAELRDEDE